MVQFGCKEMYKQLRDELGMVTSGQKNKDVPSIIKNLIGEAKRQSTFWYDTLTGKKAIAWLLGYFDGDGTVSRKKSNFYPIISASSKKFMESIKSLFQIKYKITQGVNETTWKLYLGLELYKKMMLTYKDSMQRKRHPDYRDPNGLYLYP